MLEEANDIDFAADAEALAPTGDKLANISDLVVQALALQGEVADLEAKLKAAKAALRLTEEVKLPEAITNALTLSFTTVDGVKVEVKEDLKMEIPKKNRAQCNAWLRANELGDLIVPTVEVTLLKGQDNVAAKLTAFLDEEGFSYKREDTANTASVKAAFKRQIEAGKDVPLTLFGGHQYRKAVITLPSA